MERLQANVENLQKQLAVREREKTELANQRREEEMAHVDVCAAMNRTIDELRQSLAQVVGERDTIRATVQEWQETIKEIEVRKSQLVVLISFACPADTQHGAERAESVDDRVADESRQGVGGAGRATEAGARDRAGAD